MPGAAKYALWVILGFSVLAVAVAIERVIVQWKFVDHARALHKTVMSSLGRGAVDDARSACERSRSPLADIYLVGVGRLGKKSEHIVAAVNRERLTVMADLKRRLWMLGTIGATAPFIGLLGTVVGIMNAFGTIAATGANDFDKISGPIAEALWATAVGIAVAVEAVIIFNYLNQKVGRISQETRMLTEEFLEALSDSPKAGAPKSEDKDDGTRNAA